MMKESFHKGRSLKSELAPLNGVVIYETYTIEGEHDIYLFIYVLREREREREIPL